MADKDARIKKAVKEFQQNIESDMGDLFTKLQDIYPGEYVGKLCHYLSEARIEDFYNWYDSLQAKPDSD